MNPNQIAELVESRFLPLTKDIRTPLNFQLGEVFIHLTRDQAHLFYQALTPNQFTCVSTPDWTSITFCPSSTTNDDLVVIHDSLIDIWNNNIKDSSLAKSKREQLQRKITELELELNALG